MAAHGDPAADAVAEVQDGGAGADRRGGLADERGECGVEAAGDVERLDGAREREVAGGGGREPALGVEAREPGGGDGGQRPRVRGGLGVGRGRAVRGGHAADDAAPGERDGEVRVGAALGVGLAHLDLAAAEHRRERGDERRDDLRLGARVRRLLGDADEL